MIAPEMQKYIERSRAQQIPDAAIRQALVSAGWNAQDVDQALSGILGAAQSITAPSAPDTSFIEKWSWGGFVLSWIFFIISGAYQKALLYFLGGMVPILNLVLIINAGLKGRKIAWEKGSLRDFESFRKRQVLVDKIALVWLVISIILTIALLSYVYSNSFSSVITNTTIPSINTNLNAEVPEQQQVAPTTEEKKTSLTPEEVYYRLEQAGKNNDKESMKQYIVAADRPLVDMGEIYISDFTFISQAIEGDEAIVQVFDAEARENLDMVFIREDGEWRLSMTKSIERMLEMPDAPVQIGSLDLSITDITVEPMPANISNKDTTFKVSYTNIGTGSIVKSFNAEWTITGGDKSFTGSIGIANRLDPGESGSFTILYDTYRFLSQDEEPGDKKIMVTLNYNNDLDESNTTNNSLEKTFSFLP